MKTKDLDPKLVADAKAYYLKTGCPVPQLRRAFGISRDNAHAIANMALQEYSERTKNLVIGDIKPETATSARGTSVNTLEELHQKIIRKADLPKKSALLPRLAVPKAKPFRPKVKKRNKIQGLREMELLLTIHGIPFQKDNAAAKSMRVHFTIPHKKIAIQYTPHGSGGRGTGRGKNFSPLLRASQVRGSAAGKYSAIAVILIPN